jgi:histidyl-tRNA synthetase
VVEMIQAIRGMNDILPDETPLWQYAEQIFRRTLQNHGYQEIRTPILEKTELFKRSVGEATDIVEKEMYTFLDRNQDSLTLRPEGTACYVRAGIEHGILYNQVQRLWHLGPYFRYERPQKGRCRQFHQCSAEVFGLHGPDIDAELIVMTASIIEKLSLKSHARLQLNTLGNLASRQHYRKQLIHYFKENKDQLDEDSERRLDKNPMRILDSKNPSLKELISNAPKLIDYLDDEALTHFEKLQHYLTHAGVTFELNPCLVRGLDYYNKTVFEWVTDHLGAQGSICGGGRYDTLVEQLGGKPTPAVGFAFGMERILLLMQQKEPKLEPPLHAYLVTDTDAAFSSALKLANYLRSKVHGLKLMLHCGGGSFKNQFKKADKSGALYAIIMGEHEIKTHSVSLKSLKEDIPQQSLYQDELAEFLKLKIAKK